ncbi:MAG TPA: gliding motility-associated C-terminal domain-containing protein [Bacteroidia bacterium]|nr:gliding motility-associated C-terminal domain-containing protein [Bacteroidia bacterium]
MKRAATLLLFAILSNLQLKSQLLCVNCYDQNDSISSGVHNLIQNGSFEMTTCSSGGYYCPNSSGYVCDISNWTCSGGGPWTYAAIYNNSIMAVVAGNNSAYMGNYFCNACSNTANDTACFTNNGNDCMLDSLPAGFPNNTSDYGGATGVKLSQTVSNLVPGDCYVLEFWGGGEDGGGFFSGHGVFGVDVGFGNMLLRCKPTDPNSAFVGTRYIIEFIATSTSHTITFTNWGHVCSSCTELVLDDVKLYTLGELSSTAINCSTNCQSAPPPEPVCDIKNVIVPNVFTPNGDNTNDSLTVQYACSVDLTVYNRWGQKVFSSNGTHISWDGRFNNNPVSEGVYYYTLELNGTSKKGFVQVIR